MNKDSVVRFLTIAVTSFLIYFVIRAPVETTTATRDVAQALGLAGHSFAAVLATILGWLALHFIVPIVATLPVLQKVTGRANVDLFTAVRASRLDPFLKEQRVGLLKNISEFAFTQNGDRPSGQIAELDVGMTMWGSKNAIEAWCDVRSAIQRGSHGSVELAHVIAVLRNETLFRRSETDELGIENLHRMNEVWRDGDNQQGAVDLLRPEDVTI